MAKDGTTTSKYCEHCGTVTVFALSANTRRYYCTVCGAIFE